MGFSFVTRRSSLSLPASGFIGFLYSVARVMQLSSGCCRFSGTLIGGLPTPPCQHQVSLPWLVSSFQGKLILTLTGFSPLNGSELQGPSGLPPAPCCTGKCWLQRAHAHGSGALLFDFQYWLISEGKCSGAKISSLLQFPYHFCWDVLTLLFYHMFLRTHSP